ncbi:hypothetical protein BGZ54_009150 [Gamsiella multidivaricata]|nr:hypothetical protein BGZ54_009150 [Gamsiella multidivaricata]
MEPSRINVFDISLVLDEITRYLTLKDLSRCVQVSQSLWSAFIPYLWRNIHFTSLTTQERCNLIHPNSPFLLLSESTPVGRREYCRSAVRSVRLVAPLPAWPHNLASGPCFSNLIRFKLQNQIKGRGEEEIIAAVPRILEFLAAHTTLRDIELSHLEIGSDFMDMFNIVMDQLPGLTRLVLFVRGKLTLRDHLLMLKQGQRLEEFHLSIDSSLYEYHELDHTEIELYEQGMREMKAKDSKIKDLCLNTEMFVRIMPDYLQRCVHLERLAIRTISVVQATVDLADIVRDHCLRLRHLDIRNMHMSGTTQASIIAACTPSAAQPHRPGLESLKLWLNITSMDVVLQSVLSHRTTLTSLSVSQRKGLTAIGLQQIVTNCANLKSLIVKLTFMDTLLIPMDDIKDITWSCRNLITFALLTVDHCTATGRDPAIQYLEYLYTQLGTIPTLEVVSFRMGHAGWIPQRSLFLDGLEQLYNLKRMRIFGFHKEGASMLRRRHIESMLENWPRLEQLAGLLDHYRTFELASWLMKARPDLELSAFSDGLNQ